MKILIVDDHQILSSGIKNLLHQHIAEVLVDTANTGSIAIEKTTSINYDIILLDINLPDTDGIKLCKKIRAQNLEVKIIALSSHEEAVIIKKTIQAGANSYVVKSKGENTLLEAIEKVTSDGYYFPEEITHLLLGIEQYKKRDSLIPVLTRREKEVLHLILQEMTTIEIAKKLFISEATVTTHRQNLLSKLGARNTAGLVKKAFELGLVKDF